MRKSFLILISLFIFVVGISCASAASLDADDNVVADEGPALLVMVSVEALVAALAVASMEVLVAALVAAILIL